MYSLLRLLSMIGAALIMAGALCYIVPNLMDVANQQQTQQVIVALDRAGQTATSEQPLQSGYATGGATVIISSVSAMLERGLPLGGSTPTKIVTYPVSAPFGVWVQSSSGSGFVAQTLPITVTVNSARQLGVSPGIALRLASLPAMCFQIAIGTPAGATPPDNATFISCANGAVEQNVRPD